MHATIRRYEGVDQNRTVELTGKGQRDPPPEAEGAPWLWWLLPDRSRQRHLQLAHSLRDT
jgi:hypothetical protein